jgi:CHAD domain-containing protein
VEILGEPEPVPAERVHEVRKSIKRLRALVCVVRSGLPHGGRRLDRGLRDVNRQLSIRRDSDAVEETFRWLSDREAHRRPIPFARVSQALQDWRREMHERPGPILTELCDRLAAIRRGWQQAALGAVDWPLLGQNIRRAYRGGRRAAIACLHEPHRERFHDLRKQAKQTLYHLELLQDLSPPRMRGEHAEFDQLTELLGRHQDLVILAKVLPQLAEHGLAVEDQQPVQRALQRRRSRSRAKAGRRARRVYAERPRRFVHRLAAYWQAWRSATANRPSRTPRRPSSTVRKAR